MTGTKTESSLAVVARVYEMFDSGDVVAADTLFAPDLVDHNLAPGAPSATEAMRGLVAALSGGFTGVYHRIDYQAETANGWVVTQWVMTGKHTGPWFGTPASGRDVSLAGIDLHHVVDGRITEIRHVEELLQLQAQITG